MLQQSVHERAMLPSNWRKRFHAMLAESPRPSAKALKSALIEAEKINHHLPELGSLRHFVGAVNAWISRANKLLTPKKSIKKRGRRGNDDADDMDEDGTEKDPATIIQDLITSADALGFEAPETLQVRQLASTITDFQNRARATLEAPERDLVLRDVEGILLIGEALPVELPELGRLRTLVNRLRWMAEMNEVDEAFLELKDVIDYVDRAETCEVSTDHEFVRNLLMKLENGKEWLAKAEKLIEENEKFNPESADAPTIQIHEVDELLRQDVDRPVVGEVMGKLGVIKGRVQSAQATLRSITSLAGHTKRGTIMQVQKAFSSARAKAGAIDLTDMEEWRECVAALEQYQKWLDALKQAFGLPVETSNTEVQDALYRDFEIVVTLLDPEDDMWTRYDWIGRKPRDKTRMTCNCRRKAGPKMVECRQCTELYHPSCLSLDPADPSADKRIKCTYCRVKDYLTLRDPKIVRPSIDRFVPLIDEREWSFKYPVDEQDTVKSIIETAVRVSKLTLPLAFSEPNPEDREEELVIQHWIRKLHQVPFEIEIRRTGESEETVQLYPALIKKLTLVRKKVKPPTAEQQTMESLVNVRFRNGWPTLIFRRWLPGDRKLRCLCAEKPRDAFVHLACSRCDQLFHASCVSAPVEALGRDGKPWACPFCMINDGMEYPYAEVRSQLQGKSCTALVQHDKPADRSVEHCGTPIYVDGPETIRRGLRYVTRMEPNLAANPRAINLEVLTFYADAPVVPGSIGRAFERARAGQGQVGEGDGQKVVPDGEGEGKGEARRRWEGGNDGTRLASLIETSYRDAPSSLFRRRDTPTEDTGYAYAGRLSTDTYRPGSSAGPSTYRLGATEKHEPRPASSSVLGVAASAMTTRLPLRENEESVYRRMGWSTYNHAESPAAVAAAAAAEGSSSVRMPRPETLYASQREGAYPRAVGDGLERGASLLVEPLAPSRFTAQMHIPPFRG